MLGSTGSKTTITTRKIPLFTERFFKLGNKHKNPKNFNCGPLLLVIMLFVGTLIVMCKNC
jgi:hypothetical protein